MCRFRYCYKSCPCRARLLILLQNTFKCFILLNSTESYHAPCFPAVPGGRMSPQRVMFSARPHTQASNRTVQFVKSSRALHMQQRGGWHLNNINSNEGNYLFSLLQPTIYLWFQHHFGKCFVWSKCTNLKVVFTVTECRTFDKHQLIIINIKNSHY